MLAHSLTKELNRSQLSLFFNRETYLRFQLKNCMPVNDSNKRSKKRTVVIESVFVKKEDPLVWEDVYNGLQSVGVFNGLGRPKIT